MWSEYASQLLDGTWVTVRVGVLSVILACVLGLIGAACKLSTIPPLRWMATLYTTVIRGVPDLVWMLLLFFGGQILFNNFVESHNLPHIDFNQFVVGILTLGFIYGAYFTESFRGAFMAVQKGQLEAGAAYGMTPLQVFRRVMFPQMVRYALPSISNNWLVLLKSTAVISMTGLAELLYVADTAGRSAGKPMQFLLAASFIYLGLTAISSAGFRYLERRYSMGVRAGEL